MKPAREGAGLVVYVDSGSTDGSIAMAREMGVEVVELELDRPFTAARARNAGFERAVALAPEVEFVQVVDGDCEIAAGWLEKAVQALRREPDAAVVCGRRRERRPEASIYNRLCDMEWDTPVGEARACGGDAMIRAAALREIGGYDAGVIAGEEPEMCFRLRQRRWRILRLDAEMTLHDAAMTRFGQWWKRNVRAGHAYAEATAMHGRSPERFRMRETRSNWFWGAAVPLLIVVSVVAGFVWWPAWLGLALLGGYGLLFMRVYLRRRRGGQSDADAMLYAIFTVIGKVPQAIGQARFLLGRMTGHRSRVIEYKSAAPAADAVTGGGGRPVPPENAVRS